MLPSVDLLSDLVGYSFTPPVCEQFLSENNLPKICIVIEFPRCRVLHLRLK